jgi:hypothetical protein
LWEIILHFPFEMMILMNLFLLINKNLYINKINENFSTGRIKLIF